MLLETKLSSLHMFPPTGPRLPFIMFALEMPCSISVIVRPWMKWRSTSRVARLPELEFSPALSPRTQVLSVQVNGHRSPYLLVQNSDSDQHVVVHTSLTKGKSTLRIRMRNDFGASIASSLPPLGSSSRGLHVISNLWSASRD